MSELMNADRLRPWARIVLAGLLGAVGVGIIAMHLLSSGHQLATTDSLSAHPSSTRSTAHDVTGHAGHHHGSVDGPADRHQVVAALGSGVGAVASTVGDVVGDDSTGAVVRDGCGSACGHDGMLLGACLLAFGVGAFWLLARPPAARSVWPAAPATVRAAPGWASTGAVPRRHALTHHELSISRT